MEREKMLSIRQVARELEISQVTVLRHIAAQSLPATQVDGRWIIFESDFERWRDTRPGPGWPKGKPRKRRAES